MACIKGSRGWRSGSRRRRPVPAPSPRSCRWWSRPEAVRSTTVARTTAPAPTTPSATAGRWPRTACLRRRASTRPTSVTSTAATSAPAATRWTSRSSPSCGARTATGPRSRTAASEDRAPPPPFRRWPATGIPSADETGLGGLRAGWPRRPPGARNRGSPCWKRRWKRRTLLLHLELFVKPVAGCLQVGMEQRHGALRVPCLASSQDGVVLLDALVDRFG